MSESAFINTFGHYLDNLKRQSNNKLVHMDRDAGYKSCNPIYLFRNIDFNPETRSANIEFLEETYYRTVDKYVQQNYQRTPIYSDWKIKSKTIKKHVKLTNEQLEELQDHPDSLISTFATRIICAINDPIYFPSWFQHECADAYAKISKNKINLDIQKYKNEIDASNKEWAFKKQESLTKLVKVNKKLKRQLNKKNKIDKRLNKIKNKENMVLFSILTLGIYCAFKTKNHFNYVKAKQLKQINKINETSKIKNNLEETINKSEAQINLNSDHFSDYKNKQIRNLEIIDHNVKIYHSRVKSLPSGVNNAEQFSPLAQIMGIENDKFKGIYIIHNKSNDRYYVGQSKDVIRRLNQHFNKNCSPKNIIFAEDYYSTPEENRNALFEIKIIKLQTKDELDATEKKYIELYDAYGKGYNGNAGNN